MKTGVIVYVAGDNQATNHLFASELPPINVAEKPFGSILSKIRHLPVKAGASPTLRSKIPNNHDYLNFTIDNI